MITYDQIAALGPCWIADPEPGRDEAALRRLIGDGVTAVQIAECMEVSVSDRRWVLCHLLARGPRPDMRKLVRWAVHRALSVVHRIPGPDGEAAHDALTTILLWTVGDASSEEMQAARGLLWSITASASASASASADAADVGDSASAAYASAAYASAADAYAAYAYAYAASAYANKSLYELARIIDARTSATGGAQ